MSGFDILALPLAGVHLIDASAGTGKTFTIAGLTLRLLLERDLSIREILVVTYTEAATEDLRGRIRLRIREALSVCEGDKTDDSFLKKLLAGQEREAARRRLTEALRDFDEAAIFTIHGFCQRVLRENSLETGAPLAAELLADERPLLQEIVEDYWRQHIYEGPTVWVEYAAANTGPAELLTLLGRHLHTPDLAVIPDATMDEGQLAIAAERFRADFAAVTSAWPTAREEVAAIFANSPSLKRNLYRLASIPVWLAAMDDLCPEVALFDRFERFATSGLAAGVKKDCAPPAHPFFDLCEELLTSARALESVLAERLLAFKAGLFAYARDELAARKERLAIYCFDDLLQQVHRGLQGPAGRGLAREIARRYPAALIDEFQDTDPVQYAIFAAIYGIAERFKSGEGIESFAPGESELEPLLFLIGDPKQAIYGFRGADIFAFLQACREVTSRFDMDTNYRAAAGLVEAVNLLFARPADPFVFNEIDFAAVAPAARKREGLLLDGVGPEPFQLWFLTRPAGQAKQISKEEARARLLRATAVEIVRLLTLGRAGRATLDGRPVGAGDIAVLVRTNREARLVQEELLGCGVGSVLHGMENLFATREAVETARLLAAVAEPADEARVRLALVT
ncbi:MAG: UvrD-helicase domain-containing protein, partial [Deltaproteobacteria bacterium]